MCCDFVGVEINKPMILQGIRQRGQTSAKTTSVIFLKIPGSASGPRSPRAKGPTFIDHCILSYSANRQVQQSNKHTEI